MRTPSIIVRSSSTRRQARKLSAYAVAGISISATESQATIVYTDLGPSGVTISDAGFDLDFDGDQFADVVLDFFFARFSCTTYGSCGPYGSSGWLANPSRPETYLVGETRSASAYDRGDPRAFSAGELIEPSMYHGGSVLFVDVQDVIVETNGNFRPDLARYLGVSFKDVDHNRHLGWVSLSLPKLLGFAYETEPNKPIVAGDQGSLPSVPGDTNGDGLVDLEDLNNVRNNFGASGEGVLGDTNGDDLVDLEDLNAVRNNFGVGGPVPEPPSLVLLAAGAAGLGALRRRRARQTVG